MKDDNFIRRVSEHLEEAPDYPGQREDEVLNRQVEVDYELYKENSSNLVPTNISSDKRIIGLYYMSNEQLFRTVKEKEPVEFSSEHLNITLTPYVDHTSKLDEITKLIAGDDDDGYTAPYTFSFLFDIYFAIVDIIREKNKMDVPNPRDVTLTEICERVEYSNADSDFRKTDRFRTLVFSAFNAMRKTFCFARPANSSGLGGKLYDMALIDAYCNVDDDADVSRREVYINIIALSPLFLLYEKDFILLSDNLKSFPRLITGETDLSYSKIGSKIQQVAWKDYLLRIIAIAEEQGELEKISITNTDGEEEVVRCRIARVELKVLYGLIGSTSRMQHQRIRTGIEDYFHAHPEKFVRVIPRTSGKSITGYSVYIRQ